jgi:2-methylcitrate synthase
VAYLLIHGELPNSDQLAAYKDKLKTLRDIPDAVKIALEQLPKNAHPMDVMRTGCSVLGTIEQEDEDRDIENTKNIADRLISCFGSMLIYWYHFSHNGKK